MLEKYYQMETLTWFGHSIRQSDRQIWNNWYKMVWWGYSSKICESGVTFFRGNRVFRNCILLFIVKLKIVGENMSTWKPWCDLVTPLDWHILKTTWCHKSLLRAITNVFIYGFCYFINYIFWWEWMYNLLLSKRVKLRRSYLKTYLRLGHSRPI